MRVPSLGVALHSPFTHLRPSRAIHKCVPHRAGHGSAEGTVAEAKVAAMNTGTNFHYEAATIIPGVPLAFSKRYPCPKVSMSVFDRTSNEEESKVEFVF